MTTLTPDLFFDLKDFAHKEVFANATWVWEALNRLTDYLNQLPLGVIEGEISAQAYLINPEKISIGRGTVVEPGAYIKGPCFIGENCTIRHGAYIRGDLLTGNGCVIGHDTEVKHSIFLNQANAAHFAYVGDSILGNRVNLGAGTKCANLKLNHDSISIRYQSQKINTGRRKLGAIIGDDSQLGCNSVTNPGAFLGKKVFCYPCINIGGIIADKAILKDHRR